MADNVSLYTSGGETNDEMKNMYLNFSVAGEIYGVEIRHVFQILGMQEITEMPEMSLYMKGFIKFRGNVIPVVSMSLRFGKPDEAYTDRTCIVVVRAGDKEIGLIVDAIQETITIEPENILPPPTTEKQTDRSFILGVAKLPGDETSVLIDVLKLFGDNF